MDYEGSVNKRVQDIKMTLCPLCLCGETDSSDIRIPMSEVRCPHFRCEPRVSSLDYDYDHDHEYDYEHDYDSESTDTP